MESRCHSTAPRVVHMHRFRVGELHFTACCNAVFKPAAADHLFGPNNPHPVISPRTCLSRIMAAAAILDDVETCAHAVRCPRAI
jgi:hypothetical protein